VIAGVSHEQITGEGIYRQSGRIEQACRSDAERLRSGRRGLAEDKRRRLTCLIRAGILPCEHPIVLCVRYVQTDRSFARIDDNSGRRRQLDAFQAVRTVHP
jgi:hypothetical protein